MVILAPSDLFRRGERRGRTAPVEVGGRVVWADSHRIDIADAFVALRIEPSQPIQARPGDLLVARGRFKTDRLVQAELVWHRSLGTPPTEGEFTRLARSGLGPRLVQRQRAFRIIREHFEQEDFLEVDTPLLARTPGLDANVDALRASGGYLVTSPEFFLKRLLVGGLPRVFQLSHCFRAEELGPWHEPEFSMLEWYRAFATKDAIMADTEHLVSKVAGGFARKPRLHGPRGVVDVTPPFSRLTVARAFYDYAGIRDVVDLARSDEDRYFQLWVDRIEPALARKRKAVFLVDFPSPFAALARPTADARYAERFELYAGGIELCNGYGELTDPHEHLRRFDRERRTRQKERRPVYPKDKKFLAALKEGMPEAAGNALGVDRLIALALGVDEIHKVMGFARAWR